jgi:hypothetical protein
MGIKFHCPNGHKLNVKSYLAGKRGICPHCGAKFRIPADAPLQATGDEEDHEAELVAAAAIVPSEPVAMPTLAAVAMPAARAEMPVIVASAAPVSPVALPKVAVTTVPVPPIAPTQGATTALPLDPIADSPSAVWYVRPPSGGQFGPAHGDVMRKWLGEGRVSADSLVWRDGWPDWKPAATIFPSLGALHTAVTPVVTARPVVNGAPTGSISTSMRTVRPRKQSNGFSVGVVVVLGLLSVTLLGVFVVVVFGLG